MLNISETNIIELIARNNVPGVSIAIIEDGKLNWCRGYGIKSVDTKIPIDVNTVFEGASFAKPLFAYAVLQFFKKAKLSIDEPLVNYYPYPYTEWGFSPDNFNITLVTLRHILSHTSGFSNWDRLEGVNAGKLKFIPGERFSYSGEGYIYLQRVVEFLSGHPLAKFMQENIFAPFNMHNSSYIWLDKFSHNISEGHGKRNIGLDSKWSQGYSAYSLYTTPSDMANFLIEIITANNDDDYRLNKIDINKMLSPQIKITSFCSWGLGWGIENTTDGDYCWQWGDAGNFQCYILGSIEKLFGIIIMTNSENGLRVCEHLIHAVLSEEHPCASQKFLMSV